MVGVGCGRFPCGSVSWRLTDAISIEARGENITNELVPAAISSAGIVERATPRTLWIGGRVTF